MAADMARKQRFEPDINWLEGIQLAPPSPSFLQSSGFEQTLLAEADSGPDSFLFDQVPRFAPPPEDNSVEPCAPAPRTHFPCAAHLHLGPYSPLLLLELCLSPPRDLPACCPCAHDDTAGRAMSRTV